MSNYPNLAAEAGDKYLAMLAQGQDQIVDFVRSSREMMPQMPAPQSAQLPFAMPSPRELADAQYDFAARLLKQQQEFAKKLYSIGSTKAAPKATAAATRTAKSTSSTRRSTRSKAKS